MLPRAKSPSPKGLLLLEAILSAIVMTTGLVFISRVLGSQLSTVRGLEERNTTLSLAHNKLAELEAIRSTGRPLPPDAEGACEPPYEDYEWAVIAQPREVPSGEPPLSDVVLRVKRADGATTGVRVAVVWPGEWVPAEWPSQ